MYVDELGMDLRSYHQNVIETNDKMNLDFYI